MGRTAAAALLLVLLAPPAAADGWKDLDGKPAPSISATKWLNVDEGTPSTESLRGKVWLLNFIGIH